MPFRLLRVAVASLKDSSLITLFLCGDVMTGRGLDQVLPHPADPRINEDYMTSAEGYVELAEAANGPIARPVEFAYVWGDALAALERVQPDARIINLETAVTRSEDAAPKGINYRMSPENVGCLTAAGIDCCLLANNHVLDWGTAGLFETLDTLDKAKLRRTGAGRNSREAARPAIIDLGAKGRVVVFAFGSVGSGIPRSWGAAAERPGVNLLPDLSDRTARQVGEAVRAVKRPGDVVVLSVHWGSNWGYAIEPAQRRFAHLLIDLAGADVVHGHSSHHAKGIEVHEEKLILYGCGDFLTDYEGIRGYEAYRDDLVLMYFPRLAPSSGKLDRLEMVPLQIRNFRLQRPSATDVQWLHDLLDQEGAPLGTAVTQNDQGALELRWR